jgi:uncharacterized protein (TIGR04255 family)
LGATVPDCRQPGLADFENPPVVETVLSVQFERLSAMRAVHFGLFWRKIRQDRFPKSEERPALEPVVELFSDPKPRDVRMRFEAQNTLALPRLWLLNAAGTEMIQLQNDRFIKNWRKVAEKDIYPHYEPVIRPAFAQDFQEFQSFAAEEKLSEIKVNQCEVTYVNHIVSGEGWEKLDEIDRIFTFWKQPPTERPPGLPSDLRFRARFPIQGDNGHPIGRLHVEVQPALHTSDNRPMYVMNLTARGQQGTGLDFFDVGRQWIVKSFENLTTARMHAVWRKK